MQEQHLPVRFLEHVEHLQVPANMSSRMTSVETRHALSLRRIWRCLLQPHAEQMTGYALSADHKNESHSQKCLRLTSTPSRDTINPVENEVLEYGVAPQLQGC